MPFRCQQPSIPFSRPASKFRSGAAAARLSPALLLGKVLCTHNTRKLWAEAVSEARGRSWRPWGSPCGQRPILLQKGPYSNRGQLLVTLERSSSGFFQVGVKNKTNKTPLYLFLPSCQGAPPGRPDHGFLLRGEVLGRKKGAEQGPLTGPRLGSHLCIRPPPTQGANPLLTWSLVFSDSDELSEFSSSDGDMLA